MKTLFAGRWTVAELVRFHSREKMLLLAHDRSRYGARTIGRRRLHERSRAEIARGYTEGFLGALERMATRGRHANVLAHMAGFLRGTVDAESRRELASLIEDYRKGTAPLVVPLTLIRHHVRAQAIEYLAGQSYLEPHPRELTLRNHV